VTSGQRYFWYPGYSWYSSIHAYVFTGWQLSIRTTPPSSLLYIFMPPVWASSAVQKATTTETWRFLMTRSENVRTYKQNSLNCTASAEVFCSELTLWDCGNVCSLAASVSTGSNMDCFPCFSFASQKMRLKAAINLNIFKHQFPPHRKQCISTEEQQPINVVYGNNRCLFWQSTET
jgi:hypothetical protein